MDEMQQAMDNMGGDDMGGMDMGDTAMSAMPGMEPISSAGVPAATQSQGAQPLPFVLDGGVKVFNLTAAPVRWKLTGEATMTAWAYNGTVPGPAIRVTEGDRVRITLKNDLPEATSIHWHGIPVPNAMDGVPPFTQTAVAPGQSFTYEFTASPAGSYMYHSHVETDKQIPLGLYAPFVIEPKEAPAAAPAVDKTLMLSEVRIGADGQTYAAMPMAGAEANYFTINGKSFPDTEKIQVKRGDVVRLRLENVGQLTHPMHLHGASFKIVATDGNPVPEAAQLTKDTIAISPGERYDIEFVADNPGTWVLHCHVLHHVTNDNVEPGGLITVIEVT
ncbi:MAG: copper oxidase [Chloroflexi bacterium]|nr:copper oxidase [Chloroflexota bacterium]